MSRNGFDDYYAEYSPEYVLSLIDNGENLWYPLINPSQYKRALEEFVKYGQFIQFPTDLIYEWMEIILKNTVIIDRITEFSGHTSFLPVEAVRDYFGMDDDAWEQYRQKLIAEESLLPSELFGDEGVTEHVSDTEMCFKLLEEKGIYDKCQLPDGSDAWTDYGLKTLYDIIEEYNPETSTPEQTIVIINKALDVTHQRGDLPSAFIKGGSETLSKITNESQQILGMDILMENFDKYYFSGKCNETDDGNIIQEITHWDEWDCYPECFGLPQNDDDIKPVEIGYFNKLTKDEPKPRSIDYCGYNKRLDILWAYDTDGIHWFYTKDGNYLFNEPLTEELVNAKSKGQGDLYDIVLKNPTMKELDSYDKEQWRVIATKDGNFWFGDIWDWVHDDLLQYLVQNQGYPWTCEMARLVVLPDYDSYMICIVVNAFEETEDERIERTEQEIQQEFNEKKQILMNCNYIKKYIKNPVFVLDRRDEEAEVEY